MLPANNIQVEAYTLSSISESITADSSKVATALSELADEDLVRSRKVRLDVYVPKNQEGFRILSGFASKEYIGYSPYWAIIFAFGLFLATLLAFGNFNNETYAVGVRNGAILSFVVCFVGGGILQNILIEFRRWQLVSEKSYRIISDLIKHSLYVFIPLLIVGYLILTYLGRPLESTAIVGLLGISVACSFGYEQVKKTKT